jgi:hypothetical protein
MVTGNCKKHKIKSVPTLQGPTTAKVVVYEKVLSTGKNLLAQFCLIKKDYLKHLTDTKYFRYVLGEHTCVDAKYTRCIFRFHV